MTGVINGTGNVEGVHIDNGSLFYYTFGTFVIYIFPWLEYLFQSENSGVRFILFTIQWLFMYSTTVNITVQLFCATRAHILSTFEIFQVEMGNNSLKNNHIKMLYSRALQCNQNTRICELLL